MAQRLGAPLPRLARQPLPAAGAVLRLQPRSVETAFPAESGRVRALTRAAAAKQGSLPEKGRGSEREPSASQTAGSQRGEGKRTGHSPAARDRAACERKTCCGA